MIDSAFQSSPVRVFKNFKMQINLYNLTIIFALLLAVSNAFKIHYQPRITNGRPSEQAQFPFFAALDLIAVDGTPHFCGGSIISSKWILTAAHCVYNIKKLTIYLGLTKTHISEEYQTIDIALSNIYLHAKYKTFEAGLTADIALIRLPQPVKFSKTIQPIELPSSCEIVGSYDVIALGNGRINSTHHIASILQWVQLTTIPNDLCSLYYKFMGSRKEFLCTEGTVGRGVCSGDSGGPLVRKCDYKLVGVASFARIDDCAAGFPSGFTRISSYLGWISKVTGMKLAKC